MYAAIKRHGNTKKLEMDKKRAMLLGIKPTEEESKKVRFARRETVKKLRRKKIVRDLPPSDDEVVKAVVTKLTDDVVEAGEEERVLGGWFRGDVDLDLTGGTSADKTMVPCTILCVVGNVTIFQFDGEKVLPKPKPNMDDDAAMDRFEACLQEYGLSFDEMIDSVEGDLDLDDPNTIIEACVVGAMERNGWEDHDKYVEVKRRLRKALTVPLDWEKLLVLYKDGKVDKVVFVKAPAEGGTGDGEEIMLNKFKEKVMKGGASMRFMYQDR